MSASSSTSRAAATPASDLASSTCTPCRKGGTPLTSSQIASHLPSLHQDWSLSPFPLPPSSSSPSPSQSPPTSIQPPPPNVLSRHFLFRNFSYALQFANRVGEMAEEQGHHPALVVEWGRVSVAWWTHSIGGLHDNDFICAAKTDGLAELAPGLKGPKSGGAERG